MARARPLSRFAKNPADPSSVQGGYKRSQGTDFDEAWIKRNLAPYKKYGLNTDLQAIAGMTDQQRYNAAAKAVIKKHQASLPKPKPPAKPRPRPRPRRT
jgi:hypothetical protein